MANKKLSQKEIAKRMIRLRNLEKLHRISKQMRDKKDELIKLQAEQIENLEKGLDTADQLIQAQAIRIAELETMVFGKKKKPPIGTPPSDQDQSKPTPPSKPPRDKASFKRAIPADKDVTETIALSVDLCACGGQLTDITTHTRYVEDVPLPDLTTDYSAKLVTKYLIQRGICTTCGKVTSGQDLGGSVVSLGPNVRLLVTHLIAGVGVSYSQVVSLLFSLYGLTITDSEIARVLQKQHLQWQPAYQQLLSDIRSSPVVHSDETPWPIQDLQGHGYAWNLSDAYSSKVCFALQNSRGVTHAESLFGSGTDQPFSGTRISDDYGAYRTLPGSQQLCWAHLYRCIRDLRYNDNLCDEQLPHVQWWYEQFAAIYQDLTMYLNEPFDETVRNTQADELWQRVQALCQHLIPLTGEPEKLTRLKAQLTRAGRDKLFVCLPKNTPCDNNRAERDLRQLVLKRKRSFGSKSEKGAQALATVLSICTTTWRMNPTRYFQRLAAIS
jgi:transposase